MYLIKSQIMSKRLRLGPYKYGNDKIYSIFLLLGTPQPSKRIVPRLR